MSDAWRGWRFLWLLTLTVCNPVRVDTQALVTGQVTTEAQTPIAGATVVVSTPGVAGSGVFQTVTDATGRFSVHDPYIASQGRTQVLAYVTYIGYAPTSQLLSYLPLGANYVLAQMRPVDATQTIMLGTGAATATLSAQRLDGGALLSIPAESLVDAAGNPATGPAQVELTYWQAIEPMSSQPGALLGDTPTGPTPLLTYGMADIQVTQNGNHLQVAPGKAITLQMQVGALQRQQLAAHAVPPPNLWYLEPTTGTWSQQGSLLDGALTYDTDSGMFTATLPHMSAWNVDGMVQYGNGGCITGKAVNACNPSQPLPNYPVRVFFMSWEQTFAWNTVTDSTGNYCIALGLNAYLLNQNNTTGTSGFKVHYFASGSDPNVTNMCDPAPGYCTACDPNAASGPCSGCRMDDPDSDDVLNINGYVKPAPTYDDQCNPPSLDMTLYACHFCPGDTSTPAQCSMPDTNGQVISGGCTEVATLVVPGGGCNCVGANHACKTSADCCPNEAGGPSSCIDGLCNACTKVGEGTVCDPGIDTCCPAPGSSTDLVCADYVCVPSTDPRVTTQQ